jgi:formylglycine-generating enzyme required for sulfatase activity
MSFHTIDELVSILLDPFAKTNPEIRGGARDRTILTREHDENGVFFVRKVNEGRFSVLSKHELRLMEDIAERAPDDPYVDEYLAKLLQTRKDYNPDGLRSEIVMQWHGFDLGDFVRLLPVNYNDNWRNSTFLLQLLRHALRALHALHSMGIIHSDIKRDNITLEFNPAKDFLKNTREIVLRPKNITLIDFGISLDGSGDYNHLKRIGFASYAEGGELYSWKAERLREAHEELNRGKDDLIRNIDYRVDLFGLSHIFKDYIKRGLLEPEDHPHRVCLQQVIAELEEIETRGNASHGGSRQREALYTRWRELIERAFKEEQPTTLEWVFKMPANKVLYQEEDRKAPEAHLSYEHTGETLTQSPSQPQSQTPSLSQAQPQAQPQAQAQPQPQPARRMRKGLLGVVALLLASAVAVFLYMTAPGNVMELVLIPAGDFMMGCENEIDDECEYTEEPRHLETISKPFYLGKYEVTQGEWKKVMGSLPPSSQECNLEEKFIDDEKPVICVSWDDIQTFIKKLNGSGGKYRLPTEAEWEYAARTDKGKDTRYWFGNNSNELLKYAWFYNNAGGVTHARGDRVQPNPWGLYDMYGNVGEILGDPYATTYARIDVYENHRMVRGGDWHSIPGGLRSAHRYGIKQDVRSLYAGFRLALSLTDESYVMLPPEQQAAINRANAEADAAKARRAAVPASATGSDADRTETLTLTNMRSAVRGYGRPDFRGSGLGFRLALSRE